MGGGWDLRDRVGVLRCRRGWRGLERRTTADGVGEVWASPSCGGGKGELDAGWMLKVVTLNLLERTITVCIGTEVDPDIGVGLAEGMDSGSVCRGCGEVDRSNNNSQCRIYTPTGRIHRIIVCYISSAINNGLVL